MFESLFDRVEVQSFTKYLRQILVFLWNSAIREKFIFCLCRRFLVALIRVEDWALDNNSNKFWDLSDVFFLLLIFWGEKGGGLKAYLVSSTCTYLHIYNWYPRRVLQIVRRVLAFWITLLIGLCLYEVLLGETNQGTFNNIFLF